MKTVDRIMMHAAPEVVWPFAVGIEQWPTWLSHYRWVTRHSGAAGESGVVEMAAWRPFGVFRWPTWWQSQMDVDATRREIRYRHVAGVTKGMDVLWTINPTPEGWSDVTIVHEWDGPQWPLVSTIAAEMVIGPVFVHGIASRTLAGIEKAVLGRGTWDVGHRKPEMGR